MNKFSLAQVFIKKFRGQIELLLVLENFAGARHREKMSIDLVDYEQAIRQLAKRLYYRGDVVEVRDARLRLTSNKILIDNKELLSLLIDEFESYFEDE